MTRLEALIVTVGFATLLALPPAFALVAPESAIVPHEKRERAELPSLTWDVHAAESLPAALDAWWRDHIGLRYRAVVLRHWIKRTLFGESPTESLIVGRDGWLFLADDYGHESLRGDPFDDAGLDAWAEWLRDLQTWLGDRDTRLLIVVAPSKASIYPDKLPEASRPRAGRTRTDQFIDRLRADAIPIVDLRDALSAAARDRVVYHRLDTHWNGDGALAAYDAILSGLHAADLVGTDAPLGGDALVREVRDGGGDLAQMLHAGPARREARVSVRPAAPRARVTSPAPAPGERPPLTLATDDASLPNALVYRDSFATALVPLLAEHFRNSTWHWTRHVEPADIESAAPDVVIYELTERYLMAPVPANRVRGRSAERERAAMQATAS